MNRNAMFGAFFMLALVGSSMAYPTAISDAQAKAQKLYVDVAGTRLCYTGAPTAGYEISGSVMLVAGSQNAAYMKLEKYPKSGIGIMSYDEGFNCPVGRVNGVCPA